MALENDYVLGRVQERWGDAVLHSKVHRGDLAITVRADALPDIARFLRDDSELQYLFLTCITGVDYLGRTPRFEAVYHFTAPLHPHRVVLKVGADEEDPRIPTLAHDFPTATYQEREAYDMFGIIFDGHPDLQRILMPEDWDGHPQRKTEPLVYEEVAFTFNHDEIDAQKPYARE